MIKTWRFFGKTLIKKTRTCGGQQWRNIEKPNYVNMAWSWTNDPIIKVVKLLSQNKDTRSGPLRSGGGASGRWNFRRSAAQRWLIKFCTACMGKLYKQSPNAKSKAPTTRMLDHTHPETNPWQGTDIWPATIRTGFEFNSIVFSWNNWQMYVFRLDFAWIAQLLSDWPNSKHSDL